MLRSCKYCGRIHDAGVMCLGAKKAQQKRWDSNRNSDNYKFRHSSQWTNKSIEIKKRDSYLCQCCLRGIECDGIRYTTDGLEVHHIDSLTTNYDKRLDDDNLITVCRYHHELCESGKINKRLLSDIARDNNDKYTY